MACSLEEPRGHICLQIAFELKQRRYIRMGVSDVFIIGFFVFLTYAFASFCVFSLSPFSRAVTLFIRKGNGKPNLVYFYFERRNAEKLS